MLEEDKIADYEDAMKKEAEIYYSEHNNTNDPQSKVISDNNEDITSIFSELYHFESENAMSSIQDPNNNKVEESPLKDVSKVPRPKVVDGIDLSKIPRWQQESLLKDHASILGINFSEFEDADSSEDHTVSNKTDDGDFKIAASRHELDSQRSSSSFGILKDSDDMLTLSSKPRQSPDCTTKIANSLEEFQKGGNDFTQLIENLSGKELEDKVLANHMSYDVSEIKCKSGKIHYLIFRS